VEKERKTKFKWFWAWNDEEEEKWLEEMSQKGWHLEAPGFPGFYRFAKGEPCEFSYRLDFRAGSLKSLEEYRQICRDAGWEELGRMGSWYYFRKECRDGARPEFFSDSISKVQKYRRLLLFLVIFLPILVNGLFLFSRRGRSWPFSLLSIVYVLLFLLFGIAILRLLLRIKKLKKG
jgi:hypothetical protein